MRLIDADALCDVFANGVNDTAEERIINSSMRYLIKIAPTVKDAYVKNVGVWQVSIKDDTLVVICSLCYEEPYRKSNYDAPRYCPNCGAVMRKNIL